MNDHRRVCTLLVLCLGLGALTSAPLAQQRPVDQVRGRPQIPIDRVVVPQRGVSDPAADPAGAALVLNTPNGAFAAGQTELTETGRAMLTRFAATLKDRDGAYRFFNLRLRYDAPPADAPVSTATLPLARARAVGLYLIQVCGVPQDIIRVGAADPAANAGDRGRRGAAADPGGISVFVLRFAMARQGGPSPGGEPTPPAEDVPLPAFPWPPPNASAQVELAPSWLPVRGASTLGNVADRLLAVIGEADYRRWSFSSVPHGFALVTQLEQTRADGTPAAPDRWNDGLPSMATMPFADFLRALIVAPVGYYRVIVFVSTDQPWQMNAPAPTGAEAQRWLSTGLNRLPSGVANLPYTTAYTTTALVYEFTKRSANEPATLVGTSSIGAMTHLERSGVLRPLSR